MLPNLYRTHVPTSLTSVMDDVERHWHKVVDNFFRPESLSELKNKVKNNSGYPKIDVFTNGNSYTIQASVPGVKPDDLTVEAFDEDGVNYVRLSGHMSEEYTFKDEETNWQTKELCRRAFTRTVALPGNLEGEPEAKIKDGIVTLKWKVKSEQPAIPTTKVITLKQE